MDLIESYLKDMERGINVSGTQKGSRSKSTLKKLRTKMNFISKRLPKKDLSKTTVEDVHELFSNMRNGKMLNRYEQKYKSVDSYVKVFKSFWHWYMKSERRNNKKEILDITMDLESNGDKKSEWVYFGDEQESSMTTEKGLRLLMDSAKWEYRVLLSVMFDSGARFPWEGKYFKVSDLKWDEKSKIYILNVRDEIAKRGKGRRIKLLLSSDLLKQWIKKNKLKSDMLLFPRVSESPIVINRYLGRLCENKLGKKGLTMRHFRHNSACYWLARYKSHNQLMYRFGWINPKMVGYYSEFLGQRDQISEEDLLVDITKADIEKELDVQKQQNIIMEDKVKSMEQQMEKIQTMLAETKFQKMVKKHPKSELVKS
ncbi:hypothetical protein ACFL1H_02200 [Nanoarchaeota archaeon]